MAKQLTKPWSRPLAVCDVYKAAAKAKPLGTVEAADADEAIQKQKAAAEFKVIASKRITVARR